MRIPTIATFFLAVSLAVPAQASASSKVANWIAAVASVVAAAVTTAAQAREATKAVEELRECQDTLQTTIQINTEKTIELRSCQEDIKGRASEHDMSICSVDVEILTEERAPGLWEYVSAYFSPSKSLQRCRDRLRVADQRNRQLISATSSCSRNNSAAVWNNAEQLHDCELSKQQHQSTIRVKCASVGSTRKVRPRKTALAARPSERRRTEGRCLFLENADNNKMPLLPCLSKSITPECICSGFGHSISMFKSMYSSRSFARLPGQCTPQEDLGQRIKDELDTCTKEVPSLQVDIETLAKHGF